MKGQTRNRKHGIGLAAMAVAAVVACASVAWAAQPKDEKRSPQNAPATRSAGRENPPPATNRRSEGQGQPQFRRSSDGQAKSAQTRRESPVNRSSSNNGTPPANRTVQRDAPPPPIKRVESTRLVQQKQLPPANSGTTTSKRRDFSNDSKLSANKSTGANRLPINGTLPANRTVQRDVPALPIKKFESTRLAQNTQPPPNTGNRRDLANDKKDAGANGAPIKREIPKNIGKGPLVKGIEGAKTPNSSSTGKKSSIENVRNRLGGNKGQKNIQPQPNRRPAVDVVKRQNVQKNMFQERLKTGDLKRVTGGETAKKLKLAEQYRMYQQGDVARRLDLQKHGSHPIAYRGMVSPMYQRQCVKYHYWGPSFFAGVCWYPRWNPWVDWSWHYRCRPYWDPRPMWCRPVVYVACPVWVYWNTPTWTPLPTVACGTWVDLKPVQIAAAGSDLELVAVRFVDPGHPEEKLGPRYRVWFRNNGSQPITQPFNVMLFAGNDGRLAANMPQAGVRVTGIDAADMQSVDIRLPVEVYAMRRDAQGNPAPFSVLQVLVDAGREVAETTEANNGASLAPADVLPVDPASFELQPKAAKPGEEILLAGEGFGPQPGRVLVQVNGREMDGEIVGWYDLGVRWTMPKLALAAPVEADVIVIRGDGAAANPVKLTLTP